MTPRKCQSCSKALNLQKGKPNIRVRCSRCGHLNVFPRRQETATEGGPIIGPEPFRLLPLDQPWSSDGQHDLTGTYVTLESGERLVCPALGCGYTNPFVMPGERASCQKCGSSFVAPLIDRPPPAPAEPAATTQHSGKAQAPQMSRRWTGGDIADAIRFVFVGVCVLVIAGYILFVLVHVVTDMNKSPEQQQQELIQHKATRIQAEMEDERNRRAIEMQTTIEAIKRDMEKNPDLFPK